MFVKRLFSSVATGLRRVLRHLIRELFGHADDVTEAYPRLSAIGPTGAYYLLQDKDLVRRHVETVVIEGERTGKRRLTIDLALPREPSVAIATTSEGCRFYVPVALMAKEPPTSNINLRDETGATLPLLNREQNAGLTFDALISVIAQMLDQTPPDRLRRALREVVFRDGLPSAVAREYAYVILRDEFPVFFEHDRAEDVQAIVDDFSENSLIWIGLTGRPGARRVIKFEYDISVDVPPIPARGPSIRTVLVRTPRASHVFEYRDPGDLHQSPTLLRVWTRIATAFGWAAIPLMIESPHFRGCWSYHMQVRAPEGLEVRDIQLLGDLTDERGDPAVPQREVDRTGAHLYFARATVERYAALLVLVRPGRRGFLALCLLATGLTCGNLWAFAAHASAAASDKGVSAAILLVVPAFLAAFVVRPGEHELAIRLFTGVRFLVLVAGVLSAAAAAALIGVRPSAWSLASSLHIYAVTATVATGLLAVSWILAFQLSWDLASYVRTAWGACSSTRSPVRASRSLPPPLLPFAHSGLA